MMKLIGSAERIKILINISDQLWDDLLLEEISDSEYSDRIDVIRKEMMDEVSCSFTDLQNIASNVGYILTKKPKALGFSSNYNIASN